MSKSGIPVVSEIGSGISAVGSAVGSFLGAKTPDVASAPGAPTPADATTGSAMQTAEEEQQTKSRGEAANFLTSGGGAGISGTPTTSRAVLLGN